MNKWLCIEKQTKEDGWRRLRKRVSGWKLMLKWRRSAHAFSHGLPIISAAKGLVCTGLWHRFTDTAPQLQSQSYDPAPIHPNPPLPISYFVGCTTRQQATTVWGNRSCSLPRTNPTVFVDALKKNKEIKREKRTKIALARGRVLASCIFPYNATFFVLFVIVCVLTAYLESSLGRGCCRKSKQT